MKSRSHKHAIMWNHKDELTAAEPQSILLHLEMKYPPKHAGTLVHHISTADQKWHI